MKESSRELLDDLIASFQSVEDPRVRGRSKHLLIDIVVLSVCAILCGAQGISEIEEYGTQKEQWLKQYLTLSNGIPSHDTIARVLSIIDAEAMEAAFLEWVGKIIGKLRPGKSLSLDGKSVSGTEPRFSKRFEKLHLVSVYSHELGLSLMQAQASGAGPQETDAALGCLDALDLKGVTVMADAGIGNRRLIEKVIEKKGHYLVPVKKPKSLSLEEMKEHFEVHAKKRKFYETQETVHGRSEHRSCALLPVKGLSERFIEAWPSSSSVFLINRKRIEPDPRPIVQRIDEQGVRHFEKNENQLREQEQETYYVSSRTLTAKEALCEARKHWGIENSLHWILDVDFAEDSWTVRGKNLARSLSLIRKIAFNVIKKSKTKGSIRARIKRAGWNDQFLAQLLFE